MKPAVYFMDARSDSADTSLIAKAVTVFDAAGLDELISPGDVVALKVHCGEWNSSAYLRPVYARALADRIQDQGAWRQAVRLRHDDADLQPVRQPRN